MEALQPAVAPSPHARKGAMLASMSVPHLPTHLARGSLIADSTENYARGAPPPVLTQLLSHRLCSAMQWDGQDPHASSYLEQSCAPIVLGAL